MIDSQERVTELVLDLLWGMEVPWLEDIANLDLADEWLAIMDELASEGREDDKECAREMLAEYLWGTGGL